MIIIDRVRHVLGCRRIAKRLDSFLDQQLSADDAAEVAAHLAECERCGLMAERYRSLIDQLGRLAGPVDADAVHRLERFADQLAATAPDDGTVA
jgi:anti-sigma factor RsiW